MLGTPATATERPPMYGPMLRQLSLLMSCWAGVDAPAARAASGERMNDAAITALRRRFMKR